MFQSKKRSLNSSICEQERFLSSIFKQEKISLDLINDARVAVAKAIAYSSFMTASNRNKIINHFQRKFWLNSIPKFQILDQQKKFQIIINLGLAGVGKTLMSANMASYIKTNHKSNVIVIGADNKNGVNFDQLHSYCNERMIESFYLPFQLDRISDKIQHFKDNNKNVIIIDTPFIQNDDIEEIRLILQQLRRQFGKNLIINWVTDSFQGIPALKISSSTLSRLDCDTVSMAKMDNINSNGPLLNINYYFNTPIMFISQGSQPSNLQNVDHAKAMTAFISSKIPATKSSEIISLPEMYASMNYLYESNIAESRQSLLAIKKILPKKMLADFNENIFNTAKILTLSFNSIHENFHLSSLDKKIMFKNHVHMQLADANQETKDNLIQILDISKLN